MRNGLAVDQMSIEQLWATAFRLVRDVAPLSPLTFHERDASIGLLYTVLNQIELRGEQLQLFTPTTPYQPDEAS
jgi:hypothetical protein